MSERERWIVYPLLFFALGASLRDKLLQRVDAKEIYCESLKIVDPHEPNKLLAELGIGRAIGGDPSQVDDRVGYLRILNGEGKEICKMASDMILHRLIAQQLFVVDPVNQRPLVLVGTEAVPGMRIDGKGDPGVSFQGVIYLNNRPLGTGIRLAPPAQKSAPKSRQPSATSDSGQADGLEGATS